MTVAIIDTTVFCELLGIPGKSNNADAFRSELTAKVTAGEILLLPMTTIVETGNHIGQCSPDGAKRRYYAQKFVESVQKAVDGEAPFSPTPFFEPDDLRRWLAEFPEWTKVTDARGKGSGLGDLTIQKEWERQCELNPARRVYIWSGDARLTAYDRPPRL